MGSSVAATIGKGVVHVDEFAAHQVPPPTAFLCFPRGQFIAGGWRTIMRGRIVLQTRRRMTIELLP
jgi:hypothetical protein